MKLGDIKNHPVKLEATVVIACYNHLDYLEKIIHSLGNQIDIDLNKLEFIFTHDGSKPSIVNNSKRLVQKLSNSKIVWQPDDGFRVAKSRNNAIKMAKGKIIIFLDGDMIPERDFLYKHWIFHSRNKFNKSVLAGNRRLLDKQAGLGISLGRSFFNNLRNLSITFEEEEEFRLHISRRLKYNEHPWRVGFTCNLSVINSDDVVFDENIMNRFGHEDLDLMYRLWRKGYRFQYDNNLTAYHIGIKKPGYGVHEGADSNDIVNHVLTGYYLVNKFPNEPFMDNFLNCLQYFSLDKNDYWFFSLDKRDLESAKREFENWCKKRRIQLGKLPVTSNQ